MTNKDHGMQATKSGQQMRERSGNRWMMVLYDTILYALCWVAVFVIQPSLPDPVSAETGVFYLVTGYVLFFGFRFLHRCYRQIWRLGTVRAFSRELGATLTASAVLLAINRLVLQHWPASLLSVAMFAAGYMVVSLAARFVYYYCYTYAQQDTPLAKFFRRAISLVARVDFGSDTPGATLPLSPETKREAAPGSINELQAIAERFTIQGEITSITQINKGYINKTYCVETLSERGHVHKYTMQRINTNVFPDVDALMENFKLTTTHLYGKLHLPGVNIRGSVHSLRPTRDGHPYLQDASGCWRMLTFFDDVYSLDIPDSPETFYQAGNAFGMFVKEMSDVEISQVKEVIPNFHNTMSRYQDLEKAIAQDPKGRVKQVQPEIAFVRARADKYGLISSALESGKIPTRICHNDCNLNNILFDKETKLPVAIIDLDTVMPSTPLYDFGDSIRIGTNTATDDEKDLSKVSCDLNLYAKYARGYLEACGDMLTKEELQLLPYASLIITSEDGIRFLMDHINGDTYYHIYYPGQNLDRARTQLKLVEDMERKLPQIQQILKELYAELGLHC